PEFPGGATHSMLSGLPSDSENAMHAAVLEQRGAGVDGYNVILAVEVATQLGEDALFGAAQSERRDKEAAVEGEHVDITHSRPTIVERLRSQQRNANHAKTPFRELFGGIVEQ